MLALAVAGCGDDQRRPASSDTADLPGRLLFSDFDEQGHEFGATHLANPDGSGPVDLALPGPEGGARWSHDGSELAVMTTLPDGRVGTAVIGPDGSVRRVLGIPVPHLDLVCTVWSPDDRRLACEGFDDARPSRRGVYVVDAADGSHLVRLTSAPAGAADVPGDVSPDGRTLVLGRCTEEESCALVTVPLGGGRTSPLGPGLGPGLGPVEDPGRWSPDGRSLVTSVGGDVIVLSPEGAVRQRIHRDGHHLFGPDWSPDGRWLAWSDDAGPGADVVVARPDGSDARRVTRTRENEIAVDWGP